MTAKAKCPECGIDCKNPANLSSHLRARHPDYLKPEPTRQAKQKKQYESSKLANARLSAERAYAGADIAPLPAVVDPARREACSKSLRLHCKTYFPTKFSLPFGRAHDAAITKAERAILTGNLYAYGMPRGGGKTEIAKAAAIWAIINGYRHYVQLIGATDKLTHLILLDIKRQLAENPLLLEDYPEVCYPLMRLEGTPARCPKQHIGGVRTQIEWDKDHIRLPNLPGSPGRWAVVRVASMTGAIRGPSYSAPDGGSWRPDLVIADDPQDRESAKSPTQVEDRIAIVQGDILGLAGPETDIACLMPCTVIYPDDLADQMLNREKYPEWQGEKSRMVEAFPTNQTLWDDYFKLRDRELRDNGDGSEATAFYTANRPAMDEGAVLSWPERKGKKFASALEQAMCLRRYRPDAFAAEYQNEPAVASQIAAGTITPQWLREKTNNQPLGTIPPETVRVTSGVDVQKRCVFWVTVAWDECFGGSVVDWGVYPKQNTPYFRAADARPALADRHPGMDEFACIHAGLKAVVDHLVAADHAPDRVVVDSGNWQDEVMRFVRHSPHSALLLASKGYGIGASGNPIANWKRVPGQRRGDHWLINPTTSGRRGKQMAYDANYWKSFLANRLLTAQGGVGGLFLPGGDNGPLVDHLTAEYRIPTKAEKTGRVVDEWKLKLNRENHWWDCAVMAAVAAAELGVRYDAGVVATGAPSNPPPSKPTRRRLNLLDEFNKRNGGVPAWTS